MPGAGWTVLQGQAARDYWEDARDEWIDEQDGGAVAAPEDQQDLTPDTDTSPDSGDTGSVTPSDPADTDVTVKNIPDFSHGTDKIVLDSAIFSSLSSTRSPW